MPELSLLIEPSAPLPDDRVEALATGLAEDLRTVRGLQIGYAQSPATTHGKSPQAWELGMLAVGGLFSATTMQAIARIAVAYADRVRARSIRLRSGDNELVVTGSTRVDPQLVEQLARLLAVPATTDPSAGAALPAAPGNRGGTPTGS